MTSEYNRLTVAEKQVHMFVLEASFFFNKAPGAASLVALWLCVWWASVSELLRPFSSLGILFPVTHFILLLLLPCGTPVHIEPRLGHCCLALLHSSNNANYISNGNRWGLVSGSHSLERFTNIHQRGHWLVRSSFLQRLDFTGGWEPDSLITPAVPCCCSAHRLHRADSFLAPPALSLDRSTLKPRPSCTVWQIYNSMMKLVLCLFLSLRKPAANAMT